VLEVEQLLNEFKDVFAWTYKDLKRIPLKIAHKKIELGAIIPLTHQAKYILNPNYVIVVKQHIDKLLATRFIEFVKEATWMSPIVIILKKNDKLRIYINFKTLNVATKRDPYPLPFTNEVLNIVVGYHAYSFLDGYSGYHQVSIALEDRYKIAFVIG